MTTIGRWSPSKVRNKIIDGSWVSETRYALELVRPSSVDFLGTSADIVGLGSVDFSAVTSLSLNGVFSAEYDNYMVVSRYVSNTTPTTVSIRLRLSDNNSNTGYTSQFLAADGGTVSAGRSTGTSVGIAFAETSIRTGNLIYLFGPGLAQATAIRSVDLDARSNALLGNTAATHSVATAYDGLNVFTSANNITGNVAVYGLRG